MQILQLRATHCHLLLLFFRYLSGLFIRCRSSLPDFQRFLMHCRLVRFFFPIIFRLLERALNLVRQSQKRLQRFVHRHLFLHTGKIGLARRPLFPALHLHTLQLPQADTQRTVLFFQLFQFFFRRTDTLLQGHLFCPLKTHISRTVPVIQQRFVALVIFRFHPFRQ